MVKKIDLPWIAGSVGLVSGLVIYLLKPYISNNTLLCLIAISYLVLYGLFCLQECETSERVEYISRLIFCFFGIFAPMVTVSGLGVLIQTVISVVDSIIKLFT